MSIEQDGLKIMPDPRPDLSYDSAEWTVFLSLLYRKDPDVAGILHGFRCGGLRMHRGGRGYALRPEFDPRSSMWDDAEAYRADRDKWLTPHADLIVSALRLVTKCYGRREAV